MVVWEQYESWTEMIASAHPKLFAGDLNYMGRIFVSVREKGARKLISSQRTAGRQIIHTWNRSPRSPISFKQSLIKQAPNTN